MLLATAPERKAPAPAEKPPAVVAPPVAVAPPVVVAPPPAVPVPLAPLEFPAPFVLGESEPKRPAPFDSAQGERGSALTPTAPPAPPSAIDLASTQELPREAPAPRVFHADDDHDDDEEPFVPSFSLLELLDRDPPRPTGQSHLRLEVIHHCEGHVLDVVLLPASTDFAVGALRLLPYTVPHDAAEPLQLRCSDGATSLGVLTDAGHVTPHMVAMLDQCDALVLECNHDSAMLANGNYPYPLKQRIAGSQGHLDNSAAASLLARIDGSRLRHVIAAHLSEQNNTPQLARTALCRALNCDSGWIGVASQAAGFDWREV